MSSVSSSAIIEFGLRVIDSGSMDEETELCLGHVVNEVFEGSAERKIVQRKDIDSWYGAFFESDFTTLVLKQGAALEKVLSDPELHKKLRPKIVVEGEEVGHYLTSKLPIKAHTGLKTGVVLIGAALDVRTVDDLHGSISSAIQSTRALLLRKYLALFDFRTGLFPVRTSTPTILLVSLWR